MRSRAASSLGAADRAEPAFQSLRGGATRGPARSPQRQAQTGPPPGRSAGDDRDRAQLVDLAGHAQLVALIAAAEVEALAAELDRVGDGGKDRLHPGAGVAVRIVEAAVPERELAARLHEQL